MFNQLRARGVHYDVSQTYDSDIFIGASINLGKAEDYDALEDMQGIVGIWPVEVLQAPPLYPVGLQADSSTPHDPSSNLKRAWNKVLESRQTTNATDRPLDTESLTPTQSVMTAYNANGTQPTAPASVPTLSQSATTAATVTSSSSGPSGPLNTALPQGDSPSDYGTLAMSGVDKVHAEGNIGKGVKIAIIDSGADYKHPALGNGCYGSGCLIAGGYDYVGDDFNGVNTPMPDDDPMDCFGHGSFVAGIIGAQTPNKYNVSGVAPGAELYAYRIFSCRGYTSNDIVAKAMQDAYAAGADIISLSLGERSSWTGNILSTLASRIAQKGASVISAGGNSGTLGTFYTEAPANGIHALSVGMVNNVNLQGNRITLSYREEPLEMVGLVSFTQGTYKLAALASSCPGSISDLTGYDLDETVFVVNMSAEPACVYYLQAMALAQAGVKKVLVVNLENKPYELPGNFGLELGFISFEEGQEILSRLEQGQEVYGTFAFAPVAIPNTFDGGLVNEGSSIGPTDDMYMSPQLAAPGFGVVSVVNTPEGWSVSAGTSFATPYVAGVVALYLSANGGRQSGNGKIAPAAITRMLQNAASPIPNTLEQQDQLAPVAAQGAGLIQAYDAIHSDLEISVGQLLLNDTVNFEGDQRFEIKNVGNKRQKLRVKHRAAKSMYSMQKVRLVCANGIRNVG